MIRTLVCSWKGAAYTQAVSYTHLDVYKRQLHAGTIQQQLLTGEAGADQQDQAPEQKRGWFSKLFRG